jgi:hypothetical protein
VHFIPGFVPLSPFPSTAISWHEGIFSNTPAAEAENGELHGNEVQEGTVNASGTKVTIW